MATTAYMKPHCLSMTSRWSQRLNVVADIVPARGGPGSRSK
jgi:hypothetical protein